MEMNSDLLTKVDELRKRKKVSYEEAKEALLQSGGDTLEALIYLENLREDRLENLKESSVETLQSLKDTGTGQVEFQFREKKVEAPVPLVLVGTLLLARKPKLLGVLAAGLLFSGTDVRFHKGEKTVELTKPLRDKCQGMLQDLGIDKEKIVQKIDGLGDKIHFRKEFSEEDDLKGYFSPDIY